MKEKLDAWLHIKKGGLNNFGYNDNYKAIVKSTSHVCISIHPCRCQSHDHCNRSNHSVYIVITPIIITFLSSLPSLSFWYCVHNTRKSYSISWQ